jgi:hypothetical protein
MGGATFPPTSETTRTTRWTPARHSLWVSSRSTDAGDPCHPPRSQGHKVTRSQGHKVARSQGATELLAALEMARAKRLAQALVTMQGRGTSGGLIQV